MTINAGKRDLFESMPVSKAIKAMAVPTIVSQLVNLIYSIVDTFFIGRTGNSYMMAAVTVTFTLFMMNISFANLFGIGGGSLIARLSGAQDLDNAKKVASASLYFAMASALLYSLLLLVFLTPILRFLGASDATLPYAKQYVMVVLVIGNFPTIVSLTAAHLLRNTGYSKQASIGLSGGGILNVILDPIFMFRLMSPGNEVLGAALATAISNTVACIFLLAYLKKVSKTAPLSTSLKEALGLRMADFKALMAVGIPSSCLTLLFDIANIVLNILMAGWGDLQLAAIGIVMKAERLPNAINIGICQGMLPIVAYNYASGNHDRMQSVIRTGRRYGLIVSAISMALFLVMASPIVRVFMSTSTGYSKEAFTTIAFGIVFLRIRCMASPFQFLNYHSSFCMQAMGNGAGTFIHAVVRELVFYIPFMYLLNRLFGISGLVSAIIAGEGCGALFALILLKAYIKAHKNNCNSN
ncbi:MAG: MATE family efflux transporter [Spirochaetia bacterium]|nr:MATE family efflux transporter [Spirochaetia bacterium]